MQTLDEAIAASDPTAALAALEESAPRVGLPGILREAARAAALRIDVDRAPVPAHYHAYQALAAAAGLVPLMTHDSLLPVAQAAWYAAAAPKREPHREHESRIVGEEVHLAKSLLLEIRRGNPREAVRILNGLLGRRERALVGDLFFQAAAEDTSGGGHKLSLATLGWVLARESGWAHAAVTLWPAIHYVASAPRDLAVLQIASRAIAAESVDLERAGRNAGRSGGDTAGLQQALASGDPEGTAKSAVTALQAGVPVEAILDEASVHLSRALAAGAGDDALHRLAFAHGARFSLGFSRSGHRIVPVVQAVVLAAGVPAAEFRPPPPVPVGDPAAALNEMALAMELGDTAEALALFRGYVHGGAEFPPLLSRLAVEASKEDAHRTGGHALLYADVALHEFLHSGAPHRGVHLAGLVVWLSRQEHSREVVEALGTFA